MDKWLGLPSVEEYQGLNLYKLSLNSAYVIANTSLENVSIYAANDLCYECPFNLVTELKQNVQTSWVVDTSIPVTWRIIRNHMGTFSRNRKRGIMCEMRPTFNEFGVYKLDVGRCEAKSLIPTYNSYLHYSTVERPEQKTLLPISDRRRCQIFSFNVIIHLLPLLLFISILLVSWIIYAVIKCALKCKKQTNDVGELSIGSVVYDKLKSVHFYKGILLLLLIFITSGAGGYSVFSIKYGGMSIADCLFFVYAWTVGIKIPMTIDEAVKKGRSKRSIFGDIFVKSFMLILLGITIDSTLSQFSNNMTILWRPLEMIGGAYFVVGSAYLFSFNKMEIKSEKILLKMISDLMSLLWCWIVAGFMLVSIVILVFLLSSYNCIIKTPITSTEYTYSMAEQSLYCNNDFTKWINLIFTGEPKKTLLINSFNGFSGGVLGLLSTILATMVGLKAGIVYLHHEKHTDRTSLWALWGLFFSVGAVVFSGMSYAVNCNLWPISTILFITSSSHFFLISLYVLSEYYNRGTFMATVGEISLPILSGHLLFSKSLPFSWPVEINNHSLHLLQNTWTILLWVSIALFLKRNKISFSI